MTSYLHSKFQLLFVYQCLPDLYSHLSLKFQSRCLATHLTSSLGYLKSNSNSTFPKVDSCPLLLESQNFSNVFYHREHHHNSFSPASHKQRAPYLHFSTSRLSLSPAIIPFEFLLNLFFQLYCYYQF